MHSVSILIFWDHSCPAVAEVDWSFHHNIQVFTWCRNHSRCQVHELKAASVQFVSSRLQSQRCPPVSFRLWRQNEMSVGHLSDESDWLLAHGVRITDVGFDDLGERLLHTLVTQNDKIKHHDGNATPASLMGPRRRGGRCIRSQPEDDARRDVSSAGPVGDRCHGDRPWNAFNQSGMKPVSGLQNMKRESSMVTGQSRCSTERRAS